jgi:DnaJ-like protein
LKTYYELLGVARDVDADEIKRAFRREIARYHPDKVQHLGHEFQEIATVRAAELTEAYRILMNEDARRRYDESLSDGSEAAATSHPAAARSNRPPAAEPAPYVPPESRPETRPPDRSQEQHRTASTDFIRKVTLARLRDAVTAVSEGVAAVTVQGLDAAFAIKGRGGLFRKAEPPVRLLVKFVPQADAAAVEAAWPLATNAGASGEVVCLLLLGGGPIAPPRELSVAVAKLRRQTRSGGPVLIPVDVRVWEALFPPEAPASVRGILQRLREEPT